MRIEVDEVDAVRERERNRRMEQDVSCDFGNPLFDCLQA